MGAGGAGGAALTLQRGDRLLDDYGGAADAVYSTWWPLLPLKRGLVRGKPIPPARWRHTARLGS